MNSTLLANTTFRLEQPSFGQNYKIMQRLTRSWIKYARTSVFFSSACLMPALYMEGLESQMVCINFSKTSQNQK
jgi:hypothetical protein